MPDLEGDLMDKMKTFPWPTVIMVFTLLGLVIVGFYISGQTELVEGQVLGKEPRQKAFLGGTPNFLVINGTGKVSAEVEQYHSYEVGDWFSEEISKAQFGLGYDIVQMMESLLPIVILLVVITIVTNAYWGSRW